MSEAQPLDPDNAPNTEEIEKQFAVKAVQHMATYWSILEKLPGSKLRLTKMDDEIFEHFQKDFPDIDVSQTMDENKMKSKDGKERWRNFMMAYEKKVDDYNFGTMLRNNPKAEYTEQDTIFAMRMQFYAIEIARNRAGLNDWIYEKEHTDEKA
ncbi:MAG: hypothetical protein GOMPHAMPRED_000954 [Gomphillus americanus]|uniref:Protein PBDC1 homolog n=1 Tax=Gomphillus americanus TaxID=1940652 RepID=A0A8H3F8S7_9LECA|nr:MAG: hypothetical protein GOMPHAMPRED_000954 [Gomphillus americanus]